MSNKSSNSTSANFVPGLNLNSDIGSTFARAAKGLFLSINAAALSNACCLNDGFGVFNSILVNELVLGTESAA